MKIIEAIVGLDESSSYLPNILNVYREIVEFEELHHLPPKLLEEEMRYMVLDISKAIHFLHSKNIIHRDVKPNNIMVREFTKHCWTKFVLVDFGLSFPYSKNSIGECIDDNTGTIVKINAGTGCFKAPEVNVQCNYNEKIDIYSLGASIVFLMIDCTLANSDKTLQDHAKDIKWQSVEFGNLILGMLDYDDSKRPSALEVIQAMEIINKK